MLNLGRPYHIGSSTIKYTATRLPQTSPTALAGVTGEVPSLSDLVSFFLRIMINDERGLSHYFTVVTRDFYRECIHCSFLSKFIFHARLQRGG